MSFDELAGGGPLAIGDFTPPATPTDPIPLVYFNGAKLAAPLVDAGTPSGTSNGTTGPYHVTFAAPFTSAPAVVATARIAIAPAPAYIVSAITTTGFDFYIANAATGAAFAVGTAFAIEWIAVGS